MPSNRIPASDTIAAKINTFVNGGTINDLQLPPLDNGKVALTSRQSFIPYAETKTKTWSAEGKRLLDKYRRETIESTTGVKITPMNVVQQPNNNK